MCAQVSPAPGTEALDQEPTQTFLWSDWRQVLLLSATGYKRAFHRAASRTPAPQPGWGRRPWRGSLTAAFSPQPDRWCRPLGGDRKEHPLPSPR